MQGFTLILAEYRRNATRTGIMVLSIAVAFVLFGVLHGINAGFGYIIDWLSADSLRVQSRTSFRQPLPYAHINSIAGIEGVRTVQVASFFPAYYRDPVSSFSGAAVHADLLHTFPHLQIPEAQRQAMMATRDGAVVGAKLMARFGWKIGDRVPVKSNVWTRQDGGEVWDFEIVGVYEMEGNPELANEFYINYEYADLQRREARGRVNLFIVRIDSATNGPRIAREIDSKFANSSDETFTQTDKEWVGARLRQASDMQTAINAIVGAGLFTLFMLTRNTVAQNIRERSGEIALMRAMGFSSVRVGFLIVIEALLLYLVAAAVGLLLAWALFTKATALAGIPVLFMPGRVIGAGLAIAVGLAIVSSVLSAWSASRLNIAGALRRA